MIDPDESLNSLYERAKAAYDDGRIVFAIDLLQEYVLLGGPKTYARFMLGDSLRIVGRNTVATHILESLEVEAPAKYVWTVQTRLGILATDMGDRVRAEYWFEKSSLHAEAAKNGWMWVLRGANLAQLERLSEAEECLRRAFEIDSLDDEALLNLGHVLRAKGDETEAASMFSQVLSFDPDSYPARQGLLTLRRES